MDLLAPISGLLSAFGLSSAAGLNAYIPLLTIGLLARFHYVHLQEPYALLASTPALIIIAVLAVVDFVADKVPAVDHVAHTVGAFVHPVAGAIVFASQNNVLRDIHPAVALSAGFILAGGFHATRAALRPLATTTTAGAANPVFSFVEDAFSLTLSVLAFLAPVITFVLVLVCLFLVVKTWRGIRRRLDRP